MKTVVKNSKEVKKVTSETTAKGVEIVKELTNEQKEQKKIEQAKKRALNPQFTSVQSQKRKVEKETFKQDLKSNLLEVKRVTKVQNIDTDKLENIEFLNQCIKKVNYICKNDDILTLFDDAVTKNKKGLYQLNYCEQLIAKIVKLENKKGLNVNEALNKLIQDKVNK